MLAGCATTEPIVIDCPDPLPLPTPPAAALVLHGEPSQLPAHFTSLTLADAVRVLLNAHIADIRAFKATSAKHAALIEYIESVVQSNDD